MLDKLKELNESLDFIYTCRAYVIVEMDKAKGTSEYSKIKTLDAKLQGMIGKLTSEIKRCSN
jgi:hypothetical protein